MSVISLIPEKQFPFSLTLPSQIFVTREQQLTEIAAAEENLAGLLQRWTSLRSFAYGEEGEKQLSG